MSCHLKVAGWIDKCPKFDLRCCFCQCSQVDLVKHSVCLRLKRKTLPSGEEVEEDPQTSTFNGLILTV